MTTIRLQGFKELDQVLGTLGARIGKTVMRNALKEAAEPMARKARQFAPKGEDFDLVESITVSRRLSKRQARLHRRMFKNDRAAVEMFVGPGPDQAAWNQEFGNINHGPQAFMRPAFQQDHRALLERLRVELADEINKAVARAAARAAKSTQG